MEHLVNWFDERALPRWSISLFYNIAKVQLIPTKLDIINAHTQKAPFTTRVVQPY